MSLTDLASLGTFISAIAVVVSLVYLALQVRHAEKTQRAPSGSLTPHSRRCSPKYPKLCRR